MSEEGGPKKLTAVDLFAGGGGASLGLSRAGLTVTHAVNHWDDALDVHELNHPEAEHHLENVWRVDPRGVSADVLWASPDCTHFSRAKGKKPRSSRTRTLPFSVLRWVRAIRPRFVFVENVPEFVHWGPLHRTHSGGCRGERGCACPDSPAARSCHHGAPDVAKRGQTFRAWVRAFRKLGYKVAWWELSACDYGAPTTRRRLYVVMRADGNPVCPPVTHGPRVARPWRVAAEIVDWSIAIPSIFDRKKPLADATLRRIARGVKKFVLDTRRPFLPHLTHGGRLHSMDSPVPTVTSANRGELALVSPLLTWMSDGERVGQAPRIYNIEAPLRTVMAGGVKQGLVAAYLARHFGGRGTDGSSVTEPVRTVTAQDHHALVTAFLTRYQGTGEAEPLTRPIGTLTQRDRYSLIGAFLTRYQGTSTGSEMSDPVPTVTGGGEHLGLVTVMLGGESYAIVDIGMRMLTPRELARAQGFPDNYVIDRGRQKSAMTRTTQVRIVGNSVCHDVAYALVRANVFGDGDAGEC